ncbi:glycosyltransferase [Vibrio methylphosphonaticus]|uniref:glycosyltransferase n=1 Tax=Vibrio methylphosphonaticus TaxID=2946866 RepID=UPI00202AA21D|nr:glycosyltransferase [Vibrio methylphosphonaticus]MCL9775467.1 glycosyltransferase [Vibrio methylphosphonaticus]
MRGKVLIVYHYFAHYRSPVLNSINELLSPKYEVYFSADDLANEPALVTMEFGENLTFCPLKNIWLGKWLWQKKLYSTIKRIKPTHIIFLGQFSYISTVIFSLYFRSQGVKILYWGHGYYGNEKGIKKLLRMNFNKIPDLFLVYGDYARSLMIESGLSKEKIAVIYNSLDYDKHKEIRDTLTCKDRVMVINELFESNESLSTGIFVGRLTSVKNLCMIVDSIALLRDRGVLINFIFVGTGPEKEKLEDLVKYKDLNDQVIFIGECYDENKLGLLIYSSDFCVSPGNVGLTAIHCLSYGTPVITHNNFCRQMPEFEAIQPGITGDFFEYNSLESLTSTIEKWSYNTIEQKESISQHAVNTIECYYNPEAQARIILRELEQLH